MSAGSFFRAEADRQGITVATLSKNALLDSKIGRLSFLFDEFRMFDNKSFRIVCVTLTDINIDYNVCATIADCKHLITIIEGRQPAVMARFVSTLCPRPVIALYLHCSIKEQALRFIERECGPEIAQVFSAAQQNRHYANMSEVCQDLRELMKVHPELHRVSAVCDILEDTTSRDADDRTRFRALYGEDTALDNRNLAMYDIVIDTTANQPQDTLEQAVEQLSQFGLVPRSAL